MTLSLFLNSLDYTPLSGVPGLNYSNNHPLGTPKENLFGEVQMKPFESAV